MLVVPLQACSTNSTATSEPQIAGTVEQICKDWPLIRPSRKEDKIGETTQRQILDVNTANKNWCKRG